jgi:hypothetical protein
MNRIVGADIKSDGFNSGELTRIDRTSAAVVTQAHGKYYEAVKRGNVYIGSNAITGGAIPIYSAKENALTLWNPAGSGVDLVLLKTIINYVSTTNVAGSIVYGSVASPGVLADVATGAPFATLTAADPVNALVGGVAGSQAIFSPAVNTTTDNPDILCGTGISLAALTAATAVAPFQMIDNVDGAIILKPNSAIQLVGITAVALVANQQFIWEEVPI